jgi:hypothetical protein
MAVVTGIRPRLTAALGAVLAAAWLVVACGTPARAVQTTTFSLTPTGETTSIVEDAGQGVRTVHFVLHDLKPTPITVALQVLSLTKSGTVFHTGPAGVGFSANVSLSTSRVTLNGGQTKVLPVRIDTDYRGRGEHFAVIDAYQITKLGPGINVVPHLQLAIELKPAAAGPSASGSSGSSVATDVLLGIAAALILAALIALMLLTARRRSAVPPAR